jgi:hypothetical protein
MADRQISRGTIPIYCNVDIIFAKKGFCSGLVRLVKVVKLVKLVKSFRTDLLNQIHFTPTRDLVDGYNVQLDGFDFGDSRGWTRVTWSRSELGPNERDLEARRCLTV